MADLIPFGVKFPIKEAFKKMNKSIQDAEDALNTANESLSNSKSTQNQLDTLIVESGTSDAEVLQARTNNRGKTFDILNDRLNSLDVEFKERGLNVKWHGASGSALNTTGSINSGSDQLTVANRQDFNVGQGILVTGAGVSGADLVTEITSISDKTFILADTASTSVTDSNVKHEDSQAFIDAVTVIETSEDINKLKVPNGIYNVSQDVIVTKDYFVIEGVGKSSFINFNGASLKYDAVAKGNHIFGVTLKDIRLEREGSAGPVIDMIGQNLMGVARWLFDNVHITKSTGSGIRIAGCWIWDMVAPVISGCDNIGLEIVLAQDGNSSANAGKIHGGEIQGNDVGIYYEHVSGLSFFGTSIEGNITSGVNHANNNRAVSFYGPYFEKNGSLSTDRDLIIGDVNYTGTKATGRSLTLVNPVFWDGAGSNKDYAIELSRNRNVKIINAQFNSYAVGGINNNPELSSEVTGSYEDCTTTSGIITNDSTRFKSSLKEAYITHQEVYDFSSVPAGGSVYHDFTISGVKNGDFVQVSGGSSLQQLVLNAFVHGTDTVRVVLNNNTATSVDISNSTYRFLIIPYDYFV